MLFSFRNENHIENSFENVQNFLTKIVELSKNNYAIYYPFNLTLPETWRS